MRNEVCEIIQISEWQYDIVVGDRRVGAIYLSEDNEVTFYVEEEYRGHHYCSNGLYLFDRMIHETVDVLKAVIPVENDLAKHVVEHSGYYIVGRDDANIYYQHEDIRTVKDESEILDSNQEVLYFAGGCFWGMERVFKILNGVVSTKTGYANGTLDNPSYSDIIRNKTGYKETVKVIFDRNMITTAKLLTAYFMCIHPDQQDGQGEDIGEQYQTGVYYKNAALKTELEEFFAAEKKKYDCFYVELKPLECFYEAEEYHQNYLEKNPNGYCHITLVDLNKVKQLNHTDI